LLTVQFLIVKVILIISAIVIGVLIVDSIRVFLRIQKSSVLVAKSSPFQRSIEKPALRILVLGDSTAVGTGSVDNRDSTAGRLGTLFPEAEIVNKAVNGLKIEGLLPILATLTDDTRFDIILIQIGANDIIRLTSMDSIKRDITEVLRRAQVLGERVVVLHAGDIGQVPVFPWYVRPLYHTRSMQMREIYSYAARASSAHYVDLIDSGVGAALKKHPELYYASDELHLSGEGYGLWFEEIKKSMQ
jgi:lysophospholipase L1-like esterase